MPKDKIRWIDIKSILIIGICYIPAFAYRLFNKNVWLFSERRDEARDNGFWMYKYVKENHKGQKSFYVIKKGAFDRKAIEKYGGLINYGSLKHYFMFIVAKVRLSAHVNADSPNFRVTNFMDKHHLLFNKRVFLQHGVTKDKISFGYYNVSRVNIFVCAGIKEYEFVKQEFGYPEGNVVLTGFARFDGLKNNDKNIIAVIPTWRSWLNNVDEETFINSDYFKSYMSLINNAYLSNTLANNSIKLVFYLHSEMQKFIHLFNTTNKNVSISSAHSYDLQKLLCDAKLLVTDYSSVAFDFAYLNKPTVYYHFDYQKYRVSQHPEGYFDYKTDGFGPVVDSELNLINAVSQYVNNGFLEDYSYRKRKQSFFKYLDNNNCKRIYDVVKNGITN